MANMDFTIVQGATGTVLEFTLLDEDNVPVPLSSGTVYFTAKKGSATPAINASACEIAADQNANPGEGTFTFSETEAAIDVGEYKTQFKWVDGGTVAHFFPTDRHPERRFGRLFVTEALDE